MSELTFYRQRRMDGGLRTGIDVDGELAFGLFEEGTQDNDPRLRWFVDLRCEGQKLPHSPRGARKWLLDHGDAIGEGFVLFAEEMRVGIDLDIVSLAWDRFPNAPKDVTMKIVLSAIRRVDAREMAGVVHETGLHWKDLIRGLKPIERAHHH